MQATANTAREKMAQNTSKLAPILLWVKVTPQPDARLIAAAAAAARENEPLI
jgi:hypothetical protein